MSGRGDGRARKGRRRCGYFAHILRSVVSEGSVAGSVQTYTAVLLDLASSAVRLIIGRAKGVIEVINVCFELGMEVYMVGTKFHSQCHCAVYAGRTMRARVIWSCRVGVALLAMERLQLRRQLVWQVRGRVLLRIFLRVTWSLGGMLLPVVLVMMQVGRLQIILANA